MCDDGQVASTTRTKRIRTAHRGAVTRLINQMDEALLATDVSKLKQLSRSLKNKIDTLLKLDEELLVSVEEEELDHEIEQADIVRERAELAIIRLDEALDEISKSPEKRASPRRRSHPCSDSEGEEHYGHSSPSHETNGDEPDASPSMTTDPEALSACATESSVPGGHYTSALTGTLPCTSTQSDGEPVLSLCTAEMRGMRVSNTVSTVLSPQITERPRAHLASDVGGICMPSSRVPNTSLRMMLPEIPTIVVSRGPPPLISSTVYDAARLATYGGHSARPQATDHTRYALSIPQYSFEPHSRVRFAGPASGAPLYTGLGFDFDTHVPVSGLTTPTPSLCPYSSLGFGPSTSACRTTTPSAPSVGAHVMIADPPLMPSVVPHPYVTPVSPTPTLSVLPAMIPPAPVHEATVLPAVMPPAPAHEATVLPAVMPPAPAHEATVLPAVMPPAPALEATVLPAMMPPAPAHEATVLPAAMPPAPAHEATVLPATMPPAPAHEATVLPAMMPPAPAHEATVLPVVMPPAHAHEATVFPAAIPPASAHKATVSPAVIPPAPVREATPHVKLPKLSMKKFNGDLTKWSTFWDSFSSSIDANPALSGIDKFNYLISLLESTAAEAIAGLTPTDANYEEAVATLKKRFGNPQLIINRHMEALLHVPGISSHHDIRGLRRLYDSVEAHIRGLKALRVPTQTYGGLLTSVLVNKLPPELRLIITRGMTGETWDLEQLMKIFEQEIDARERAFVPTSQGSVRRPRVPTASTLLANNPGSSGNRVTCVYCEKDHVSSSCNTITDATARKESLRKSGRCFVCLRRHHLSRDCRSDFNCKKCRGRHHVSICTRATRKSGGESPITQGDRGKSKDGGNTAVPTTTCYVGSQTPILLQTAKLRLVNLTSGNSGTLARAILDSGSQRTYVTSQLRQRLKLPTVATETIQIRTFGNSEGYNESCDVVNLGVRVKSGETLEIAALVVPLICSPLTSQPITTSGECHEHLLGLELADSADGDDLLRVEVLIGSDWYWSLVTGRVIRGKSGPTAVHTKVGWILSGPATNQTPVNLTLSSPIHTLKIDTFKVEPSLDDQLKRFWELESLGIPTDEAPVYEKFLQQIRFDGRRYEVSLPWKEHHPSLPDHYELCRKRLEALLRRLRQTPQLLKEYDGIIRDQTEKGIIEKVPQSTTTTDKVHYLPHHGVVRQDKTTSKLRIVYNASARSTGPSLNDCLYAGPKFGQSIFDILVRFRLQRTALIGDIEKAFLMISVQERDRDSLRFLWPADLNSEKIEPTPFRFTRVVFGVSSSPFLLNATISHHIETFRETDPEFVDKFLSSIYVDDLVSGGNDVQSTYEFYLKSRVRLASAGFKLRKFVTNSEELRGRILEDETLVKEQSDPGEDQSYAKTSLGVKMSDSPGSTKVLGVLWDVLHDKLLFDIGEVAEAMEPLEPTKRNLVGITARFFDPLGIVSPVTVLFKMFCQQLCEAKVGWDDPLSDEFLNGWSQLLSMLKGANPISITRCVYRLADPKVAQLVGFCDASSKAYAAVVYLKLEDEDSVEVKLLGAKTRVAPVHGITIPRLELLSALLLSKLLTSLRDALHSELILTDPVCFTDSKASLYWIQGVHHEWKQFVENRVTAIRNLIPLEFWRHCPGRENPADIPSRGMSASALSESSLWLSGPDWLRHRTGGAAPQDTSEVGVPEECRGEMRRKNLTCSLVAMGTTDPPASIRQVICPENYSSSNRLFRVTALVLRFIARLRKQSNSSDPTNSELSTEELNRARLRWIQDVQAHLIKDKNFLAWRRQLGLYQDEQGLWRCGGRMSHSSLLPSARNPILLSKEHYLTTLLISDAHKRVFHNGVRETLSELRSNYWVIRGRQIVRKILSSCVICRRLEGAHCKGVSAPPLPGFRVQESRPFQTTGVDFAGPLYVRTLDQSRTAKTWLVLYTCYSTRAVHLDLVQDMTAQTFLRSFRRFTARRGTPTRMISDNAKTFKSVAASITKILESPEVKKFLSDIRVEWRFNLEKAPWQGGVFERMIKSAKRCLRKAVGKNCLTFDELLTLVTEIEGVLNSRPLTYVYSDDVTEPLTPSHLLVGYRIRTLPDDTVPPDADDDYTPRSLTRRAAHLAKTLRKFWRRWKREYLQELREFHRASQRRESSSSLQTGEVVTVYDEGHPRGLWRLGRIEELCPSADGKIRGVRVRVVSKGGQVKIIRRPIQHIYPMEVRSRSTDEEVGIGGSHSTSTADGSDPIRPRSTRKAAAHARDRIVGMMMEDELDD